MKLFFAKSFVKTTLLFTLVSMLTACGFQLRGNYLLPEEIVEISLTSFDPYGPLTKNIENQLRLNHVSVVPPSATVPNLHLIGESIAERTLSLYQNSQAAERELTYHASYRVTLPNLGARDFSTTVTRSYLDNPRTALAKSVERDLIEDEMRVQAATQIMRQMAQLKNELESEDPTLNEQSGESSEPQP